jgi:hypothetical protein
LSICHAPRAAQDLQDKNSIIQPDFIISVGIPIEFIKMRPEILTLLRLKAEVTFWSAFIVTVHVPVPLKVSDQTPKVDPASAVAVRVTRELPR